MPKRIQRKRTKGWRMPEGAIYVGRPTRWGNPFSVWLFGLGPALEYFRAFSTAEFDNSWPDNVIEVYRKSESRLYGELTATLTLGEPDPVGRTDETAT